MKNNSSISRKVVTAARQGVLLQAMARWCPSLIPLSYEAAKAHANLVLSVFVFFFLVFFLLFLLPLTS